MFIAFPLQSKPNWRRPPWITLLLILINVLVFFGPQRTEERRHDKAEAFYLQSSLPETELPLFLESLKQRTDKRSVMMLTLLTPAAAASNWEQVLPAMQSDRAFNLAIEQGTVVRSDHPQWQAWKIDRAHYQQMRGPKFTERWMSIPAEARPETLFSSIFLHGSTSHLVGNMVFLFAFGYTVELALGGALYLLFYLLAGIGGAVADELMRSGSEVGGLGASGAISGLMAMYAVVYGLQKIRFFYQFLFYFDYVRAPAIILLPVWITNEFVQQWLNPDAGVAFMAHAGGLISGALLMLLYRATNKVNGIDARAVVAARLQPKTSEAEEAAKAFANDLETAREAMQKLRFSEAKAIYANLSEAQPTNLDILRPWHSLLKAQPADPQFHRCVQLIVSLKSQPADTLHWVAGVLDDYLARALPRPVLSPTRLVAAGGRLARGGQLASALRAEQLVAQLEAQHCDLPTLRLSLVAALLKANKRGEAQTVAHRLQMAHPRADEVKIAAQLLR